MSATARIGQDLRRYWLTYLVSFTGFVAMWLGATRIDDQAWAFAWIDGVAVVWAPVRVYVKRRTDRGVGTTEYRSPS